VYLFYVSFVGLGLGLEGAGLGLGVSIDGRDFKTDYFQKFSFGIFVSNVE